MKKLYQIKTFYLCAFCFLSFTGKTIVENVTNKAEISFALRSIYQLKELLIQQIKTESGMMTSYSYEETGSLTISDLTCNYAGANTTFNVTDDFTIDDLNVGIVMSHTYRDDLEVRLRAPSGTEAILWTRVGGSSDNFNLLIDSDVGTSISAVSGDHTTTAPFYSNTFAPEVTTTLDIFDGENAIGDWTLFVCDNAGSDDDDNNNGTFLRGQLIFEGTTVGGSGGGGCTAGNAIAATGAIRNGLATNATGDANGTTTEVGASTDYLVLTLNDELPIGTDYIIHISGRGGSATTDVFEAPDGTAIPGNQQNSPTGFTQNGQATGANGVITEVTKTTVIATKYLYFDRGSGDIEIDAVTYCLGNGETTTGNLTCSAGATEITGVVFEDYDYDGQYDSGEHLGVESITITATDSLGNASNTTSASDGTYTLGSLTAGRTYRIEFTNIPSWANPTFYGDDNGTLVQFVQSGNCANLGVAQPSDYCGIINPDIVIACYENGAGSSNTNVSVLKYKYNDAGIPAKFSGAAANPTNLSTIAQIGTVWGAAYDRETETVYTTAFLKRHVSLGPLGLGGVYMINPTSGYLGSFELEGVIPANGGAAMSFGSINRTTVTNQISGGAAGDNQLSSDPTVKTIDLDAFAKIGTTGMGGTGIEHDANKLWTINLNTSEAALISIDLNDAANPIPINGTQAPSAIINRYLLSSMSLPACTNGIFRPWGLRFHKGKGYVGGVCSAENNGTTSNLKAYLLSFDPANPASGFTEVISFDLDFNRELKSDFGHKEDADWRPWADVWSDIQINDGRYANYASPIFSDIEFRENGDLILGFMDRYSHQLGFQQYQAVSAAQNNGLYDIESAGDIYHVCLVNGIYVTEGLAGCADNDIGTPVSSSLTNDGINGTGEYYWEDIWQYSGGSSGHGETANGALSMYKGTGFVISSALDPVNGDGPTNANTQGTNRFNTATGQRTDEYMIVNNNGTNLGKSGGLSDLVLICNPAPIEIGNYVWADTNSDGIQDASESGIDGVTVELIKSSTVIATTQTANGGQYYFSNKNATDANLTWTGTGIDTALLANTTYTIRISNAEGGSQQSALNSLSLTTTDANSNNSDNIDNDASLIGDHAEIITMTGDNGCVDHSFDFGFLTCSANAGTFATSTLTVEETTGPTVTHNADHEASNTQEYLLTNQHGFIMQIATTPNFGALPQGEYGVYAINYETGGVDNLAQLIAVSALTGSCFDLEGPVVVTVTPEQACATFISVEQKSN